MPFEHLKLRLTTEKKTKLIGVPGLPLKLHGSTVLEWLLIYLLLKQRVPIVTNNMCSEDTSVGNLPWWGRQQRSRLQQTPPARHMPRGAPRKALQVLDSHAGVNAPLLWMDVPSLKTFPLLPTTE